jgi:hypothetical protein
MACIFLSGQYEIGRGYAFFVSFTHPAPTILSLGVRHLTHYTWIAYFPQRFRSVLVHAALGRHHQQAVTSTILVLSSEQVRDPRPTYVPAL